ncbi:unnamed protein product [Amoebophrya sp. A25]|nr:unnamed protein product [Amoebophrya sp. A25]|eukprot:GSA25T00001095001.1
MTNPFEGDGDEPVDVPGDRITSSEEENLEKSVVRDSEMKGAAGEQESDVEKEERSEEQGQEQSGGSERGADDDEEASKDAGAGDDNGDNEDGASKISKGDGGGDEESNAPEDESKAAGDEEDEEEEFDPVKARIEELVTAWTATHDVSQDRLTERENYDRWYEKEQAADAGEKGLTKPLFPEIWKHLQEKKEREESVARKEKQDEIRRKREEKREQTRKEREEKRTQKRGASQSPRNHREDEKRRRRSEPRDGGKAFDLRTASKEEIRERKIADMNRFLPVFEKCCAEHVFARKLPFNVYHLGDVLEHEFDFTADTALWDFRALLRFTRDETASDPLFEFEDPNYSKRRNLTAGLFFVWFKHGVKTDLTKDPNLYSNKYYKPNCAHRAPELARINEEWQKGEACGESRAEFEFSKNQVMEAWEDALKELCEDGLPVPLPVHVKEVTNFLLTKRPEMATLNTEFVDSHDIWREAKRRGIVDLDGDRGESTRMIWVKFPYIAKTNPKPDHVLGVGNPDSKESSNNYERDQHSKEDRKGNGKGFFSKGVGKSGGKNYGESSSGFRWDPWSLPPTSYKGQAYNNKGSSRGGGMISRFDSGPDSKGYGDAKRRGDSRGPRAQRAAGGKRGVELTRPADRERMDRERMDRDRANKVDRDGEAAPLPPRGRAPLPPPRKRAGSDSPPKDRARDNSEEPPPPRREEAAPLPPSRGNRGTEDRRDKDTRGRGEIARAGSRAEPPRDDRRRGDQDNRRDDNRRDGGRAPPPASRDEDRRGARDEDRRPAHKDDRRRDAPSKDDDRSRGRGRDDDRRGKVNDDDRRGANQASSRGRGGGRPNGRDAPQDRRQERVRSDRSPARGDDDRRANGRQNDRGNGPSSPTRNRSGGDRERDDRRNNDRDRSASRKNNDRRSPETRDNREPENNAENNDRARSVSPPREKSEERSKTPPPVVDEGPAPVRPPPKRQDSRRRDRRRDQPKSIPVSPPRIGVAGPIRRRRSNSRRARGRADSRRRNQGAKRRRYDSR